MVLPPRLAGHRCDGNQAATSGLGRGLRRASSDVVSDFRRSPVDPRCLRTASSVDGYGNPRDAALVSAGQQPAGSSHTRPLWRYGERHVWPTTAPDTSCRTRRHLQPLGGSMVMAEQAVGGRLWHRRTAQRGPDVPPGTRTSSEKSR